MPKVFSLHIRTSAPENYRNLVYAAVFEDRHMTVYNSKMSVIY